MKGEKTIAIDFDGVIHAYRDGWIDGSIYDVPVFNSIEGLRALNHKGYNIIIFTAREDLEAVKTWLAKWIALPIEVTNKKPQAIAYIDDRAIRFTNWQDILNYF